MIKKCFMIAAFLLCMSINGFAQNDNNLSSKIEYVIEKLSNIVKDSPKGTTYGVIENTPEKYVVNTPIGKYNITKENGGFTFMGMFAKIESQKGNIYIVDSTLGKFRIDTKKCTIEKL